MNGSLLAGLVAIAGGIGAVSRYVTDQVVTGRFGNRLPYGTLLVNLVGSLIIGILAGSALHSSSADLRVIVATGFCGGLTTWSTASFETVRLFQERGAMTSALFAIGGLTCSVAAGALGIALTSW